MTLSWSWLIALAGLGYMQRAVPWGIASRAIVPPKLSLWLSYVPPAAFATLIVADVSVLTVPVCVSLAVAALIAWRTHNLGFTVLSALVVGSIMHGVIGGHLS